MTLKALILLFVTSMLAVAAQANIPNNYTAYQTISADSSGNIWVNVTVSGTTVPPTPPMGGATHQARVQLIFDGNSQWVYGPSVCTSCNVNYSPNVQFNGTSVCLAENDCVLSIYPEVVCTIFGAFWTVNTGGRAWWVNLEKVITTSQQVNPLPPYPMTTYCNPQSSPPDWPGLKDTNPVDMSYAKAWVYCWRNTSAKSGDPWTCEPVGGYKQVSAGPPPDCTNHDKGIFPTY